MTAPYKSCPACDATINTPWSYQANVEVDCSECGKEICLRCSGENNDGDGDPLEATCKDCCITRDLPEGWAVETIK